MKLTVPGGARRSVGALHEQSPSHAFAGRQVVVSGEPYKSGRPVPKRASKQYQTQGASTCLHPSSDSQ
jgi:hypothetical protein